MEIPSPADLNDLNKVLLNTNSLCIDAPACPVDSLLRVCSSIVFRGRPVDFRKILRLCTYAGLMIREGGDVRLTRKGVQFVSLNKDCYYELTDAQKRFLVQGIILESGWSSRARDLFTRFYPNYDLVTYEIETENISTKEKVSFTVQLFNALGVISEVGNVLRVTPEYVSVIKLLLAGESGLNEEGLAKSLIANQKLGAQAEEAVVRYERKRLGKMGRRLESESVRRISQLNISAGYDIESFNGYSARVLHDRFIEVKASRGSAVRFYWTANEMEVAGRLGEQYWIYFLKEFDAKRANEAVPIMIENPAARLPQIEGLVMDVATLIITERGGIKTEPVDFNGVEGLLL